MRRKPLGVVKREDVPDGSPFGNGTRVRHLRGRIFTGTIIGYPTGYDGLRSIELDHEYRREGHIADIDLDHLDHE